MLKIRQYTKKPRQVTSDWIDKLLFTVILILCIILTAETV